MKSLALQVPDWTGNINTATARDRLCLPLQQRKIRGLSHICDESLSQRRRAMNTRKNGGEKRPDTEENSSVISAAAWLREALGALAHCHTVAT
jgi:hypothetical protein